MRLVTTSGPSRIAKSTARAHRRRNAARPGAGLSWLHLEWIDLHRGDYFASVIAYLRGQLDKLELTSAQRVEARAAFLEAVACEKAFWEMARGVGDGEL